MILFSEGNAFPLEFIGTAAAEEDEEPIRHGLVYVIALVAGGQSTTLTHN